MKIDRRDGLWVGLLAASLAAGLAASWQRWGNPLVDCGREMNQPLRLLNGERLYADVAHLYGPWAPYFNALLYRVFGVHLAVIEAHGLVATLAILALTYWIARQVMGRAAATSATLGVTWLCALKQSGNYVLPYAYAAVDGCVFGLAALALAMRFVSTGTTSTLLGAGAMAGLACLAKAEMGLAASVTVVAVVLVRSAGRGRRWSLMLVGVLPIVLLVGAVYGALTVQVGWRNLMDENHLLPIRLPAALAYYNRRMFGFDEPGRSLVQMLAIGLRLALLAAGVLSLALGLARAPQDAARAGMRARQLRRMHFATLALLAAVVVTYRLTDWDKGPFLAVPFLLVAALAFSAARARRHGRSSGRIAGRQAQLMILSTFALAMLARTLLRVRSGGAYSSYLLPAAIVVFAYAWTSLLPLLATDGAARRLARRAGLLLLFAWIAATAVVTMSRYRQHFTYWFRTPRGAMLVRPELGVAFDQALAFIQERTRPGDAVAVLPEGTSLNFFSGRPNPLNEEITTPGLLDEERAMRRLEATRTPLVLIANRLTEEFGAPAIGRDYHQALVAWVEERYERCAVFGLGVEPNMSTGDRRFFVRAYCRRP